MVVVAVTSACAGAVIYVRSSPLLFNESFWQHAHCIKIGGLQLMDYADRHQGRFPFHPRGYPNALLLLDPGIYFALTGPGYDDAPLQKAKHAGTELSEEDCGRVYIQGLTLKSNPKTAILFDKLPTPGGDHCHFPARLWAPLGREVWFVGADLQFIPESAWVEFAQDQVELLVAEGIPRDEAERLYASKPRGETR